MPPPLSALGGDGQTGVHWLVLRGGSRSFHVSRVVLCIASEAQLLCRRLVRRLACCGLHVRRRSGSCARASPPGGAARARRHKTASSQVKPAPVS